MLCRHLHVLLATLLFLATAFYGVLPAIAQTVGDPEAPVVISLPDPLTPEAINALVSRLSDAQVRQLLLERLDAEAVSSTDETQESTTSDFFDYLTRLASATVESLTYNITHTGEIIAAEGRVLGDYVSDLGIEGVSTFLGVFALAIALGVVAELLIYRVFVKRRIRLEAHRPSGDIFETLPVLGRRLWQQLVGTVIFFLVMSLALHLMMPERLAPMAHIISRWLIVVPRISFALLVFFLAPRRADLRLASCDDWTAHYLLRNLLGVTLTTGLAMTLLGINNMLNAPPESYRIGFWFTLIVFFWLAVIFIRARDGFRMMMRGRHERHSPMELWVAEVYPWFAVGVIVATWVLCIVVAVTGASELLRGGRHLVSLAVLLIAPLLDPLIRAIVQHYVPPMRGGGTVAQRAHASNLAAYTRIGRVLVFSAVLVTTARLWGLTPLSVASAGVGERFAINLVQALLISVVGYLIWEVVRLIINRRLANENTGASGVTHEADSDAPRIGAPPSSRLGTILPPISWTLQAIVITLTALTALGNLGINVTPLLAGAGVAGIAIGFGAQKLVSDIMSGMFFLIDDAFRLNEYIDVGGTVGTVERISLRSIQLRDSKGPVLIIPYSNIRTVTNFGRDWGIMKLKFTVPFDTDLEKVRKIFKKIGQEMMDNPALAPGFIEPFKSQGVGEFNEYGIVVRGKFVHKPGTQFGIRKEIFKRVQEEFAANGIQFARREVRVSVSGSDGHLTEEETTAAAAAAAETIAQQERDAAAKAKAAGQKP